MEEDVIEDVFDGGAPAAACGATSAGSANSSSRARGGQSSFPVIGEDVIEGIFEHSGERVLLAARHLDRDRGAAMLESTARRVGQEKADIDSGLW